MKTQTISSAIFTIASAIITIISVLGTFVGIIALDNGWLKQLLIALFAVLTLFFTVLTLIGIILYINSFIDIFSAWSTLSNVRKLGIKKIYIAKISNHFSERLSDATKIRIMVLSGEGLIKNSKNEIIQALVNKKAFIQVLVCEPNTQFVLDTDEVERRDSEHSINHEINKVQGLLNEYVKDARKGKREEDVGKLKVGFYSTHLRSSLVICNEDWGWLTFSLPPERAVQSISLELFYTENGLLSRSIKHFDRCWEIVEQHGNTKLFPQ